MSLPLFLNGGNQYPWWELIYRTPVNESFGLCRFTKQIPYQANSMISMNHCSYWLTPYCFMICLGMTKGGSWVPLSKSSAWFVAGVRVHFVPESFSAERSARLYRVSQLKRNTFQWFIVLRLEGKYMIWCGRVNLSDYFDTILWIIFPWMNKQQTKTPKETMSKLCVISFFNWVSFTHHVKFGTRYIYFGHNTCSCYISCKTIFTKSGIKIIRKNYST